MEASEEATKMISDIDLPFSKGSQKFRLDHFLQTSTTETAKEDVLLLFPFHW